MVTILDNQVNISCCIFVGYMNCIDFALNNQNGIVKTEVNKISLSFFWHKPLAHVFKIIINFTFKNFS